MSWVLGFSWMEGWLGGWGMGNGEWGMRDGEEVAG